MLIAEYSYETDIKVQRREAFRLGKEEGAEQKAIETAKEALKNNISLEIIAKITGLSLEKVQQINEEIKNKNRIDDWLKYTIYIERI